MITEMARKFFAFFSVLYCGRVMNESAWDTLVDTHKILFVYGCELSRIALNSESEDEHQKRTIRHMMSSSEKISFHRMLDDDEIWHLWASLSELMKGWIRCETGRESKNANAACWQSQRQIHQLIWITSRRASACSFKCPRASKFLRPGKLKIQDGWTRNRRRKFIIPTTRHNANWIN